MKPESPVDLIAEREQQIRRCLAASALGIDAGQRHLDSGSPERAYWHLGYQSALRDVLAMLGRRQ